MNPGFQFPNQIGRFGFTANSLVIFLLIGTNLSAVIPACKAATDASPSIEIRFLPDESSFLIIPHSGRIVMELANYNRDSISLEEAQLDIPDEFTARDRISKATASEDCEGDLRRNDTCKLVFIIPSVPWWSLATLSAGKYTFRVRIKYTAYGQQSKTVYETFQIGLLNSVEATILGGCLGVLLVVLFSLSDDLLRGRTLSTQQRCLQLFRGVLTVIICFIPLRALALEADLPIEIRIDDIYGGMAAGVFYPVLMVKYSKILSPEEYGADENKPKPS